MNYPLETHAYNFFNQPTHITEGTHQLDLFYGANQQRQKSIHKNNNIEDTCYYINKYFEIQKDTAGVRHYHYIYGDNGVVALYISAPFVDTTSGGGGDPQRAVTDSLYYIHTDHLGSYCAITSPSKKVVQRNYFDPWGNYKNIMRSKGADEIREDSIGMAPVASINFTLTNRGFTGHEHYPYFKIINMNGRLYDPVIARFFSPDKYVANSTFTQDFNRYSYARNCPLMYTDPSGHKLKWWGWLLIGLGADALTGGAISGAIITTGITAAPLTSEATYELQKFISPVAVKFSFGFGSVNHIGIDASFGLMKGFGLLPSYRWHGGASHYGGNNVYGGYKGTETRTGAEFSIGTFSISGTKFKAGEFSQTLNKITYGGPFTNVSYENDYMFGMGAMLGRYNADGGDRWRTAAVGMNFGPFNINLNMFTGDPGLDGDYRQENVEMINGHLTYTGGTANKYRAGVLSIGFGPIRIGRNSEQIRLIFQNKLAHDILNGGKAKWFEVLDIDPSWFFYFGTGSGGTLW